MDLWDVNIDVVRPLSEIPRPFYVREEIQRDSSYFFEGKYRKNEKHCFFHYTLGGGGRVWTRNGKWDVSENHGFLLVTNDPATGYMYPESQVEPWHFVFVCFIGGNVRQVVEKMADTFGPVYKVDPKDAIIRRLLSFKAYSGIRYEMSPFDGARLVTELLSTLGDAATRDLKSANQNVLVVRARSLVEEHIESNANVTAIASSLEVTREHLSRVFKEYTGTTIHDYILGQKMRLGCELLKNTNLSVKEVSARLHYDTAENFTRAFRRVMHMNPTEFRKNGTIPMYH